VKWVERFGVGLKVVAAVVQRHPADIARLVGPVQRFPLGFADEAVKKNGIAPDRF